MRPMPGRAPNPHHQTLARTRAVWALATAMALSGCAVVTVGAAAVSVTAAVVTTGVKVTGKVIGAGIDAVAGDDEDEDRPKPAAKPD